MTFRRALLPAPFALHLVTFGAHAAPAVPRRFRILREGTPIGTHQLTFTEPGGATLTAQSEVEIAVRLAGITVFRFSHRFQESWSERRLRSANSRQDRNGRITEMTARAEGNAIIVQGPDGTVRLPPEAAPLSWWDVARIESGRPLFANDTGRALRLSWTRTSQPDGGRRWRAAGDTEAEGSWSADGLWLGWTTKGDDGSTVTYVPA